MNASHLEFSLAPTASGPLSWLETLVLSGLAIGLGLWLAPADPLQVKAAFPWPLLAPLLLGLRYGFSRGLVSACLLVLAFMALHQLQLPAYADMAPGWICGVLLCGMLSGEVRDLWERRLQRLQMSNEYRQYRLDEFTRAHQILRVSHDRLEQRVAAGDQSLRSSLLGIRDRLRHLPGDEDALSNLAESILMLLGHYGSLQVAGLYRVARHSVDPQPLSTLGRMGELDLNDPLVKLCLERGELVSVREALIENGQGVHFSKLQACVPLMDTEGALLAIVAVRQMQFFAFNERTFNVVALMAGHIADLLHRDPQVLQLENPDAQHFARQLKRCLWDVEQHDLPAHLCAFEMTQRNDELSRLFELSQRGLDLQLGLHNQRGHDIRLVLLPLTDGVGAAGYLHRLNDLVHEHFGQHASLASLGVNVHPYNLDSARESVGLGNYLRNECGLNDQQIAV